VGLSKGLAADVGRQLTAAQRHLYHANSIQLEHKCVSLATYEQVTAGVRMQSTMAGLLTSLATSSCLSHPALHLLLHGCPCVPSRPFCGCPYDIPSVPASWCRDATNIGQSGWGGDPWLACPALCPSQPCPGLLLHAETCYSSCRFHPCPACCCRYDSHRDQILRSGERHQAGGGADFEPGQRPEDEPDLYQYFTASCFSGFGSGPKVCAVSFGFCFDRSQQHMQLALSGPPRIGHSGVVHSRFRESSSGMKFSLLFACLHADSLAGLLHDDCSCISMLLVCSTRMLTGCQTGSIPVARQQHTMDPHHATVYHLVTFCRASMACTAVSLTSLQSKS
jgi:hypothetical protein